MLAIYTTLLAAVSNINRRGHRILNTVLAATLPGQDFIPFAVNMSVTKIISETFSGFR
jgi:hypothetical protein